MKKKTIFKRFRQFAMMLPVFATLIFSSCYTDYGLDSDTDYDVVITLYNKNYDFNAVQNYYLNPTVKTLDGGTTTAYESQIISSIQSNLNSLGWTEIADSNIAKTTPNTVFVGAGEFTNTTTETYCGSGYGGYYGWYYPSYYCGASYTYTTGTIIIAMADRNLPLVDGKTEIQWSAALNGLTNSSGGSVGGTVQQRITTGVNNAFIQSPYLR